MEYRKDRVQLLTDFEMLSRAVQNAFASRMRPTGRMLCRPHLEASSFVTKLTTTKKIVDLKIIGKDVNCKPCT